MKVKIASQLGRYEILQPIGAGGIGGVGYEKRPDRHIFYEIEFSYLTGSASEPILHSH